MRLKDQVTSLELSKKLKELGVKQESYFYWVYRPARKKSKLNCLGGTKESYTIQDLTPKWHKKCQTNGILKGASKEYMNWIKSFQFYSAFTVAELGEMLPKQYIPRKGKRVMDNEDKWLVEISIPNKNSPDTYYSECFDTEANARAKFLIYLLENKSLNFPIRSPLPTKIEKVKWYSNPLDEEKYNL